VGVFAECLAAWRRGEEGIDGEAAAFVVAETLLLLRATLIGLSKRR
jgi:hypothetical protein